jgi:hypothetical protein
VTGNATNVTGTVAVANGGTGATSFTSGALLKGAGTGAVTAASAADIVAQIGSTAVANATTAANGGVTSVNGSTGAVTVDLVPSSISAIGSVLAIANYSTSNLLPGDTVAGSSLLYVTGASSYNSSNGTVKLEFGVDTTNGFQGGVGGIRGSRSGNVGAFQPSNTATLSGTWRVLLPVPARYSVYDGTYNVTSIQYTGVLVQRIS